MMTRLLFASVAILALCPLTAHAQMSGDAQPVDADAPLDGSVTTSLPSETAPASTGNPVLDRLNALEARIRQLETRNAELEEQAAVTQSRVESVEVRSAKAAQPGIVPVFSDVNDNFTFKPRGVLQVDYAAYDERAGGYEFANGTDLRRARFGFEGTAFQRFKWRLDAEYVKNTANLLDAYISYQINPRWSVTIGQQKAPYGLEANTADALNTFFERSMASNAFGAVAAERRIGIVLARTSDKLNAAVGLFGGSEAVTRNPDSGTGATFVRGTHDEPWSVNGRVTWEPVLDTGRVVHLGVSAYHASSFAGNTVTIADRPNSRVDGGNLLSVAVRGAAANGTTPASGVSEANYVGGEAALVYGRFSLQGEYGRLALDRFNGAPALTFSGFNIFGSVFLTGESRGFRGGNVDKLKPFNDFDRATGHWGALELAVRYDQLSLRDGDLPLPTSPTNSNLGGRFAQTLTGGINWYFNPNFRAGFNYVRFLGRNSPLVAPTATGSAQVGTSKGDVFQTRLQVDF